MMRLNRNKKIGGLLFALGLLASTSGFTWHGHHHGNQHRSLDYGNTYHRGLSYGGGYNYGGGWSGPNVIIEVPAPNYYVPQCHTVEVCNPFGACWLENSCY
ncbi:MAG: hypothetical protein H0U57_11785 [Tatlockia sp.]|nr:hypothetical protein [Tatlockia sp.]